MSTESVPDTDPRPPHTTADECADWRERVRAGESLRSIADGARWAYQTVRHHVLDHDSCTHDHGVPAVKPSRRNGPGVHAHPDEDQTADVCDALDGLLAANYGDSLYVTVARLEECGLDDIRGQRIGAVVQMLADDGDTRFDVEQWNPDANTRSWMVRRAGGGES